MSTDRRNDRGQATRQQILATATRLFTEEGYEGTSIEVVLKACGISRGALYHHFASKEALFRGVLAATEDRVAATVQGAAMAAKNPLDGLRLACAAWLRLASDPTVRRVVLIDAPSVIGWQAWREIDNEAGLGLLKGALGMAAVAGRLRPEMVDLYAHMLLAVLIEAAMVVARSENATASIEAAQEAVEQILSRFLGVEPHAAW